MLNCLVCSIKENSVLLYILAIGVYMDLFNELKELALSLVLKSCSLNQNFKAFLSVCGLHWETC